MGTYLNKGIDFDNGDQVTADKLDSLVESATFGSGAVDNSSTQLSGGAIIVKDGGITTSKIASGVTVLFADGSAAAPSISNSGDSDTGIYFPADNQVSITTGGTEKVNIQSGFFNVNTDSSGYYFLLPRPSTNAFTNASRLEVRCNTAANQFKIETYNEGTGVENDLFVGAGSAYSFYDISAGNVGIGTSSPATKLDVSGGITVSDGVRGGLKYGTAQFPTTGTSIEFTGIPPWAKRITIAFAFVSTTGTSYKQFQIGSSSGYLTSGYIGSMMEFAGSGIGSSTISTGLGLRSNAAADMLHGTAVFTNYSGSAWVGVCNFSLSNSAGGGMSTTVNDLSGTLDRIRLTTVNGTDNFDDADINIIYEG